MSRQIPGTWAENLIVLKKELLPENAMIFFVRTFFRGIDATNFFSYEIFKF